MINIGLKTISIYKTTLFLILWDGLKTNIFMQYSKNACFLFSIFEHQDSIEITPKK